MDKDFYTETTAVEEPYNYPLSAFVKDIVLLLRPHLKHCTLIFLTMLVGLAFTLIIPMGFKLIFDRAIGRGDLRLLFILISSLVLIYLVRTLAAVAQDYWVAKMGAAVIKELRTRMFQHQQRLPMLYFQKNKTGDVMSFFSNDLISVETALMRGVFQGLFFLLMIVSNTTLLFFIEWRLALATFILSPPVFMLSKPFAIKANQASILNKDYESNISQVIQENLKGSIVIRAFGLHAYMERIFQQCITRLAKSTLRFHFLNSMIGRVTVLGISFIVMMIIGFGAYLVITGAMTIGALMAFVSLLLNIQDGANGLNLTMPLLFHSTGAMRRIKAFLDQPVRADHSSDGASLSGFTDTISFDNISLAFSDQRHALKDVTLKIEKGQKVAIIGASGSGKSSLLNLLMRFFRPSGGKVMVDGLDIHTIMAESFYSQISVVMQNTFLFNTSIRENIRQGKLDATDREIEEAARLAEIHRVIESFPDGYDTEVAEEGGNLSGGQRQRIALARALVRKPTILLLDEATSALDPKTEAAIYHNLEHLGPAYTVIWVTHRLSTVTDMDHIFVMHNGELVEEGVHPTLLASGEIYKGLWNKQHGFTIDEKGDRVKVDPNRLKDIPVLANLSQEYLEYVANHFITAHFEEAEDIIIRNSPGRTFYIIVKGAVDVIRDEPGREEKALTTLESGDYFGEISLIRKVPTTATVRTRCDTTCLALMREHFLNLLYDNPEIRQTIEIEIEERVPGDGIT